MPADILKKKFNVSEIFHFIQGEGLRAGFPCVFIRLQGCELRCSWCDTDYALDIKKVEQILTGEEIFAKASSYYCNFITFTGGEPLLQKGIAKLMTWFCDEGFTVAVETNGHQDVSELDKRIIKIMDLKCPGSGMAKNNNLENIAHLTKSDEVKFVLAGREDYEWAKEIFEKYIAGKMKDEEFRKAYQEEKLKLDIEFMLDELLEEIKMEKSYNYF